MGKIGEIFLVVIVSAIIGIIVALPFILLTKETILLPAVKAASAGMTIGLIARYITGYIFYNINKHPVFTFVSIFIIILIGTVGASILFNTQDWLFISGMAALAEIFGMSSSVVFYRYISRLNQCLANTQKVFRKT